MKVRLIALALPLGGCATVSADSNKILLESGQRVVVPAEEVDGYRCRNAGQTLMCSRNSEAVVCRCTRPLLFR